jgi:hypothetical protein
MSEHTKGPWYGKEGMVYGEEDGATIALIRQNGGEEESKANAQLIATSPELLEACKYVYKHFTESPSILWPDLNMGKSKMSDLLENAINKAEGRD